MKQQTSQKSENIKSRSTQMSAKEIQAKKAVAEFVRLYPRAFEVLGQ